MAVIGAQRGNGLVLPAGIGKSMDYKTFFEKFGGSARTKNLEGGEPSENPNKRHFELPTTSELPLGFIRLCPWEMEYLFAVARRARRGILEIGRLNGGSAFLMACANPEVPIYSVDIRPRNDKLLRKYFAEHGVGQRVKLLVGDSTKPRQDVPGVDVIFVDGNHSYESCYSDATTWYPRLAANGHMLFHDSYLGRHGVQDAVVDFIQVHPEVDVVVSPIMGASYWHNPAGSIAHLWKRPR